MALSGPMTEDLVQSLVEAAFSADFVTTSSIGQMF